MIFAIDKYLNMENYNNQGYLMRIVDYKGYEDIEVEFAEPYKCRVKTRIGHFKEGDVVNPYAPTICGVGIVGDKYKTVIPESNGMHTKEYLTWSNMLKRCYSDKEREKNKTYIDVTVDPIWFYFVNFYDWVHNQDNYNAFQDEDYCIDKDILYRGNKLYSPEKCTLVPQRVNNLLLKSNAIRGCHPIGVHYSKRNEKYIAQCGGKINYKYLGIYETEEEAFEAYKNYKETMIQKVAREEFDKGTITKQCFEALMNYRVEIDD